jgi:hypothetical protein
MVGMLAVTSDWACEPVAVGRTRAWTVAQLEPWLESRSQDRLGGVVLCVSELVTNALNAGSTLITLALQLQDGILRVSLIDDAAGWPTPMRPSDADPHGRGLIIIAALSRAWGIDRAPSGKEVWAALDW